MTIQQCKYVLEIAKTGSFTQAAKQLFIAQSSLSISVKSLEQELNIKIFDRSGNGVCLTDEGAEFVRYAQQVAESDDFISQRYRMRDVQQRLYITTQHYDFIADVFGNFLKDIVADSYKFSIREIETYNIIQEVQTAFSDIGIIAIKGGDYEIMKRYLGVRNLSFTPILEAAPHVFMRKDHPLAQQTILSNAILKDYPYVSYEQGEHNSSFFTEEMMDATYINKHIEISDRATLMNVLLITDAYTVGTGIMPSALNRGDIVSIPLESEEYYIIGYLLNNDRKVSDATRKFIDLLEKSMKIYHNDEGERE